MTFADSQVVYRDLTGPWGSFRLIVGGKDVTYFRGVPVQIGGYQLTEPYGYGPATFAFPQITPFEADAFGEPGELEWLDNNKQARLVQVDADGTKVRTVWRGFVTLVNPQQSGGVASVTIQCDGRASGRLALKPKLPDPIALKRHVGRKIFQAFADVHLTLKPFRGNDIGVQLDGRGITGDYLSYVDTLLAATLDTDGSQYTVMPNDDGTWQLAKKDTDTVDFTAHFGAAGVDIDVSDDLTERPNTIYGSGVSPENLVWTNSKYPGFLQGNGDAPDYPFVDNRTFGAGTTDADTDTLDGISVLIHKLNGMGYVRRVDMPGGYDSDVTDAVKDLQDDAGLSQTGNVNPATWLALFDVNVTGTSVLSAYVAPLAQASEVKKWFRTSNGSLSARNPNWDVTVAEVGVHIDYGTSVDKAPARKNARGILHRSQNGKNWAGTLTLTSDVFAGDHAHSDVSPTVMSRLDINAGTNVKVRNFCGNTKFHVSVVNVASDTTVTLGIDTQNRDAATLGEVIARRIESRVHPARQWKRQHLGNANVRQIEASEDFGVIFTKVGLKGNQWNVVPVLASQAGSVSRIRVQTQDDQAEFVCAVTAQETKPAYWQSTVGNPFKGTGISGVYVSNSGSGYTSAPTVSFSGGGGSGAAATAKVGSTHTVTEIVLTSRGSGYTSAPTVTISGGGGSGATAHTSVTLNDPWTNGKIQPLIDKQRALLGAWGTADQPCGYHPGKHTGDNGTVTDDPITGLFLEDAGFDYHTFSLPFIYLAIYPDRDCVLNPQRVFWDVVESDQ